MSRFASGPRGRTRVSDAVLDATVVVAASQVGGVLSVESLTRDATLGGTVGGVVGFAQGGPVGAAVGASAGAALAAAAGHALRSSQRRAAFRDIERGAPDLGVVVTARYGEDLHALAARVRTEIERALTDALGLHPGRIMVDVTDVVSPEAEFDGAQG